MKGLSQDINKYQAAEGQADMTTFPKEFPYLFKSFNKTWGAVVDIQIRNPKLKAIISSLWGYYGLPPSKLSSFYYALPTIWYLTHGGYYPRGTSQKISSAFVKFIEDRRGQVKLKTQVEKILVKDLRPMESKLRMGQSIKAKLLFPTPMPLILSLQ